MAEKGNEDDVSIFTVFSYNFIFASLKLNSRLFSIGSNAGYPANFVDITLFYSHGQEMVFQTKNT
jgi:hypothetical protein